MKKSASPETLKVLFDGECPLCRREIAHAQGLAGKRSDSALCFIDISHGPGGDASYAAERTTLLARFHVERADGSRIDGAAAFVDMWARLPGWRWLARLAKVPGVLMMLEVAYRGFLHMRPWLQWLAYRFEPAPVLPGKVETQHLSVYLERELRSDHAGETGAVYIYKGIIAIAGWRNDTELLAFASQHGITEAEHLMQLETWLPASRRSRLLGPWRLAGWLTGALPALISPRAVYSTIAAVETFVDRHYQQQIEHLERHGGPEGLLPLLLRCQADECHHRDEAATLAGAPAGLVLRAWCKLVSVGSAAAVLLARRL